MRFEWPVITKATETAVRDQLWTSVSIYNRGGIIEDLEDKLAAYHGTKYCLLTSSGTAALHSVYFGLDLRPGDEVICPVYTFFATATPILQTGATPVFVDCDTRGNIDVDDCERKITTKTKAIMITHMWGVPCDMGKLVDLARQYGIALLEDGSHAHGASFNGKKVGSFGKAAAFSLQGQKTLTGGEGGFILTDDDDLYYRSLLLGHYNKRCKQEIPATHPLAKFATTGAGLKLRAHPLAVAMANEQFGLLDQILDGRQEVASYMMRRLEGHPFIEPIEVPADRSSAWYAMLLRLRPGIAVPFTIDQCVTAMQAKGCSDADIPKSTCPLNLLPLFQNPAGLFPRYENVFSYRPDQCPRAEAFYDSVFKIPIWHSMKDHARMIDLYLDSLWSLANGAV